MSPRSPRSARTSNSLHTIARTLLAGLLSFSLLGVGAIGASAQDDDGPPGPEEPLQHDDAPADTAPAATASWELSQSAQPASGSVVEPGQQITYTLQADVLSLRPVTGIAASVDLSGVLAHADLAEPLAPGLTLSGDQLTWNQRQPVRQGTPATASFTVVVDDDAAGVTLSSVAAPHGTDGVCTTCTTTHTVPGEPSWDLTVTSNQEPGSTVLTNAAFLPAMTVQNTSDVTVSDARVVADLSALGPHNLSQVPEDVVHDADAATLTWSVPELAPGQSATSGFQARLHGPERGSEIAMSFAAVGAGGECISGCDLTYHVFGFDASVSADPAPGDVLPGEEITYTWQVQNISGGDLTGAYLRANLGHPAGSILAAAELTEPLGEQFQMFGNVLNWDIPDLGPHEQAEVSFTVRLHEDVSAGAPLRMQINTGTVRHGGRVLDPATLIHTVGEPTWELSHSAEPAPGSTVQPGDEITYTLDAQALALRPVTNVSATVDLSDVLEHATIAEPLPFGLSLSGEELTWNVRHPVHRNTPATVSFAVVVGDDADGATLTSTATPQRTGGVCTDCTVSHTVGVPSWDLEVDPNHEPGSTLRTNAAVLPRMTVTNTSGVPVTGGQVVADLSGMGEERYDVSQVPADAVYDEQTGLLTWSVPDLAVGESVTERFQVRLSPTSRGDEVSMDFTTAGAGGQCVTGCDLRYHVSGFDASASADIPAGVVSRGAEITYTWTVQNISGGQLTGAHVRSNLSDQFDPLLESADLVEPLDDQLRMIGGVLNWDIPDLGPGEEAEVSFTTVVRADAVDGAGMRMGISPGSARHGGRALTDPIVHTVGVPAWEVGARAAQANGLTIPDGGTVRPNGQVNYHLTAANTAGVPITDGVVVADVSGLMPYATIEALGDGAVFDADVGTVTWSVPDLAPGADAAVSFRANLRFADAPGAVLPLSVRTQGAGGQCVSGCQLEHYVTAIQASVSAAPTGPVAPGEQITYTWQVQNVSQAQISGAYVRAQMRDVLAHADIVEPLPEGVDFALGTTLNWSVPDLGPRETADVSFAVVVDTGADDGAELSKQITAGANSFGVTYGQRETTHTVALPAWDLSVTAAPEPGSTLLTNATIAPTLTVENTGAVPVAGAEVVVDLAAMGEHYTVSEVPDDAVYDADAATLTWPVPDLEPGAGAREAFEVQLAAAARGSDVAMDFAAVGAGGECILGCELAYPVSGFDATVSVDPPEGGVAAGQEITYTIDAQNISTGELSGAQVRMNLGLFGAPVLGSADLVQPVDPALQLDGSILAWTIPDLPGGAAADVSFSVQVHDDADLGAELRAWAFPLPGHHGGLVTNPFVTHTVAEPGWDVTARAADVRGITIPDGSSLRPNGQVNYHLTAANTSTVPITDGAVVADVSGLMPYATIEALGDGAVFDAEAGTVTWSVPDLAAGAEEAVSFRANLRFADAPGAVLPLSISVAGAGGECVSGCTLEHYATAIQASVVAEPAEEQVRPGGEITYVWRVQNTSRAQVSGAHVRAQMRDVLDHAQIVELPEGVDFALGTTLNWDVPDLGPGERAQVAITVVVDQDTEPGTELAMNITAGPNALGVSYGEQTVSHTVAVAVTPPSSLPPALAILLGLAKFVFGLLVWLS